MAGIVYDARRIKAYEGLLAVGEIAGQPKEWCDMLWGEIIVAPELLEELIYYLEHHCLTENVKCCGYSMIDLYVWQMNRYNIIGDSGKNTAACNKDRMVLHAFRDMVEMKRNPAAYVRKLTMGRGMDQA